MLRFMGFVNNRVFRHGFGNPNVTANGAVFAYYRVASQYGGIGVNSDVIFYSWMAFCVFHLFFNLQSPQGNALVYFNMVFNDTGFTNNGSSGMVNKKTVANGCARMNIGSRFTMGIFAHQSWD